MRPSELEINLSEMMIVKMPISNRNPGMSLSVTEQNIFSMNSVFYREMKAVNPNFEVMFFNSPDYKIIVLSKDLQEENIFKFHKDGRIKHTEYAQALKEKGYQIPAKYIIERSEKFNGWIGVLEEVPAIGEVNTLIKKAVKKANVKTGRKKNV